jgi:hypothetical protein
MPKVTASKYRVDATWNDVPHLDEKTKSEMLSGYPRHQRDARASGIPKLGVGAIYTVPWEQASVAPFRIPEWYPRGYGLDVGWNWTGAVWGAWDRDTDILYVVSEYKVPEERPVMHSAAIKARGEWMVGMIDPAARGRSQNDGKQLLAQYRAHGLRIIPADNSVEAGIFAVQERLETGRLKFFSNCRHLEFEYHRYHRDEDDDGRSKIVKKDDHVLDALRYMAMGFKARFTTKPVVKTRDVRSLVGDVRAGY